VFVNLLKANPTNMPPIGYSYASKHDWELRIENGEGTLASLNEKTVFVPSGKKASNNISPFPFLGDIGYVLGRSAKGTEKDIKRAEKKHKAFIELSQKIYEETSLPEIAEFLDWIRGGKRLTNEEVLASVMGKLIITVNGKMLVGTEEVMEWWKKELPSVSEWSPGQCSICGKKDAKILARLLHPLTGVASSSLSYSSASGTRPNSNAYSTGKLSNSENCAICLECSDKIGRTFNALVRSQENFKRISAGDTTFYYLFWTTKALPYTDLIFDGIPDTSSLLDVKKMIEQIYIGKKDIEVEDTFYLLSFVPNQARMFFNLSLKNSLSNVEENILQWFKTIEAAHEMVGEHKSGWIMTLKNILWALSNEGKEWGWISAFVVNNIIESYFLGKRLSNVIIERCYHLLSKRLTWKARLILLVLVYMWLGVDKIS